jgi:hypothetical protein
VARTGISARFGKPTGAGIHAARTAFAVGLKFSRPRPGRLQGRYDCGQQARGYDSWEVVRHEPSFRLRKRLFLLAEAEAHELTAAAGSRNCSPAQRQHRLP